MNRRLPSRPKVQMTVRLEPEVEKAAIAYARRTGVAVSVVVADAAKRTLLPATDDRSMSLEQSTERLLRRLGKLDASVQADLNEIRESIGLAVRTYLNHTPSIPDSERQAASMSGRIRFDRFVHLLDQNLRDGTSVLEPQPPNAVSPQARDASPVTTSTGDE